MMRSDSILFYWPLLMILEPQGALQIFLVDEYGTDSVVGSRPSVSLQFWIGGLLPYALKSLVALTRVLLSSDCEDGPQAAGMPASVQKPVGPQTKRLWARERITQRCPRMLGVISQKWGDAIGASRNGGPGMFVIGTRLGRSQAFR